MMLKFILGLGPREIDHFSLEKDDENNCCTKVKIVCFKLIFILTTKKININDEYVRLYLYFIL